MIKLRAKKTGGLAGGKCNPAGYVSIVPTDGGDKGNCQEIKYPDGKNSRFWFEMSWKYEKWSHAPCDKSKFGAVARTEKDYAGWTDAKNSPDNHCGGVSLTVYKPKTETMLKVSDGTCPGSKAWVHAKTQLAVSFQNSCADVMKEVKLRVASQASGAWVDPHNGGKLGQAKYTIESSTDSSIHMHHLTGNGKYTDELMLTFSGSGSTCSVSACSESQVTSVLDFSTNYCNLHDLYCSDPQCNADKLKGHTKLTYTEKIVENSSGQHSTKDCYKASASTPQVPVVTFMKKATAGCKKDSDCHAGGDMGGYCKSNSDCHCTAPFFGSNGKTCELTCTPTSKTPCCRDDNDCQKGGDKGAYCKSPKSTLHTTPGNGMCRCSAGFSGTTACNKKTNFSQRLHVMKYHSTWRIVLCGMLFALILFFCIRRCCHTSDADALQRTYADLRSEDDDADMAEAMRRSLAESSSGTIKPVDVPLVAGAPKPPPGVHFGSSNQV